MPKHATLSVILIVHNQENEVEATLSAIYACLNINFELIIIDDASHDYSAEIIKSVIEYQQHDNTFFFEYDRPAGYGIRLDEAFAQVSGDLLWIPDMVTNIDEDILSEQIKRLTMRKEVACLIEPLSLPDDFQEWPDLINAKKWPLNHCFLWNLKKIEDSKRYFQARLNRFQCFELALRLTGTASYISAPPFFKTNDLLGFSQPDQQDQSELLFSFFQLNCDYQTAELLSDHLYAVLNQQAQKSLSEDTEIHFEKVKQKIKAGEIVTALSLIDDLLDSEPDHIEALELKISILEKMKRYVEAYELKHKIKQRDKEKISGKITEGSDPVLQDQETGADNIDDLNGDKARETDAVGSENDQISTLDKRSPDLKLAHLSGPKISIIIPTTLDGKPFLEQCLVSISEECNPDYTEVIIIDNASLDDTHDYVKQIREDGFFNCRVVTNTENRGFASSVNQGIEQARGEYACILHNDVVIKDNAVAELASLLDHEPEIAIAGPRTNSSLHRKQVAGTETATSTDTEYLRYVDSFCMMVRLSTDLKMDEKYNPAYFEDIDFCFQAAKEGWKIAVCNRAEVEHMMAITTEQLNLYVEDKLYWQNARYFKQKWNIQPDFSPDPAAENLEQICAISDIINPYFPEPELKEAFEQLWDSETETQVKKLKFDDSLLLPLISIMMVMEKRQILRRLEDKIGNYSLPDNLILRLIEFYFKRNIYSRCNHYLAKLPEDQYPLQAALYKLKIAVGERDMKKAIPLLTDLMETYPSNVQLLKLAGIIHSYSGNKEESEKFLKIARQIAPFLYNKTNKTDVLT